MHTDRTRRGGGGRLRAALVAALTSTAVVAGAAGAMAGSTGSAAPLVGSVKIQNQSGRQVYPNLLGIDPALGVLVTIPDVHSLYLIDVGSLRWVGTIDVPGYTSLPPAIAGTVAVGTAGPGGYAIDPVHHAVYMAGTSQDTADYLIWSVSLTGAFPPRTFALPPDFSLEGITGLGYYAPDDRLYVTTAYDQKAGAAGTSGFGPGRSGHPMTLHELDAAALRAGESAPVKWSYRIPGCNGQSALTAQPSAPGFVARSLHGDFVFLPCEGTTEGDVTGVSGTTEASVIRVNLHGGDPNAFDLEFYPFGVSLSGGLISGDAAHDLVYVVDTAQKKLWAFDAMHRAWVGSVPYPAASTRGFGFDGSTGRVFFATDVRMFVTEGRSLPLPQGVSLEWPQGSFLANSGAMVFDPLHRRLFATGPLRSKATGGDVLVDGSVIALADAIPVARPFEIPDPDLATRDLAEVPGRTVSTYSAHGTGFGARYLLAGGVRPITAGPTGGDLSQALGFQFPLNQGTRDVMLGRVLAADLADSGAAAAAVGTTLDVGSASDLAQLEDPQPPVALPPPTDDVFRQVVAAIQGTAPYTAARDELGRRLTPAACQDFGDAAKTTPGYGTTVTCDLGNGSVHAEALGDPTLADSPVRIAYAKTTVTAHRDAEFGAVVQVHAEARGVDVLDQIHIGFIEQTVIARAHGRPGSAKSDVTALLKQVRITNQAGDEVYACGFGDQNCDVFTVAAAINRYLSPRIQAEVPPRASDPLLTGSPRGAQAAFIKDPYRYWNDLNSNEDAAHEVAALQITVYHDTIRPSREVLQLAAVEADAHYAIAPAASPGPSPTDGGFVPPVDLSPLPTGLPSVSPLPSPLPGPVSAEPALRRVVRGAGFLLQSPADAALLAFVWGLLFAPIYLLVRRRQLVARAAHLGGMT